MTTAEQKALDSIRTMVSEMKQANEAFRYAIAHQLEGMEKQVQQKHIPLRLENEIAESINDAIKTSIVKSLSDSYNSPLKKYAENVVARYQNHIESLFDEVVKEAIATDEFRLRVREVLISKIAKTMISGIDGSVDKTINAMKQDAIFRSRLTLTVNALVDEFVSGNK